MKQLIVDLTRLFSGNEEGLLSTLWNEHEPTELSPVIIGYPQQKDALYVFLDSIEFREAISGYDTQLIGQLAKIIRELSPSTENGKRTLLYSYHPRILAMERELGEFAGMVETFSLRGPLRRMLDPGDLWPARLMSIDEALTTLVQTLAAEGAHKSPIHKSDLRGKLAFRDHRFEKNTSTAARTPGLITILINVAAKRKLIELSGTDPQLFVSLNTSVFSSLAWAPASTDCTSRTDPQIEALAEEKSSAVKQLVMGAKFDPHTRSEQFQKILRQQGLGFFEVWPQFCECIDEICHQNNSGTKIGHLVQLAVNATREKSPESFRRKQSADLPRDRFPWRELEGAGITLLAKAGFIKAKDGTITRSGDPWNLRRGEITTLPENWKEQVEAQLILAILSHISDVGWSDVEDLAGAIYLKRNKGTIERIDRIIEFLLDRDAIELDKSTGFLRISPERKVSTANHQKPITPPSRPHILEAIRAD